MINKTVKFLAKLIKRREEKRRGEEGRGEEERGGERSRREKKRLEQRTQIKLEMKREELQQ